MKRHKRILAAVAWVALGAACSGSVSEYAPESAEHDDHARTERLTLSAEAYEVAGISVAPVSWQTLERTVRVTGTLAYDERRMAIATARVGGRVAEVVADYGQRVSAGEPLAWIDSPELGAAQAEYRRAAAMMRLREAEYQRAQLLLEGQALSRGELLRREADWRAAEAELQGAEQQLHILGLAQADVRALEKNGGEAGHVYPVRATIDGRVTERKAVPGRVVSGDEELFTIAELDSLWLFLQVFEKDLPSIEQGAGVALTCESHPDEQFRGTIDFVGQVLDPHSRTVRARAVIDNPEGELMPGMFVYATIEARTHGEPATPQLAVPAAAVVKVQGRNVVFVEAADQSFEVRHVEIGEADDDWVEARSGLKEGELIAVTGVFVLKSELLKGDLAEHDH